MSAIESNWKNTLIAIGVAIGAGIAISTLLTVMTEPAPVPLSPTSLGRTVDRFCDPASSPLFAMTYEQMMTCRDLAAQESVAASTASLVRLAWLSLFAGLAGSGFVIWTVLVARRSMELTRRTLEHQQQATRLQLRPVFARQTIEVAPEEAERPYVTLRFVNVGASSALNVRSDWTWGVYRAGGRISVLDSDDLRIRSEPGRNCSPNADMGFRVRLTKAQAAGLRAGTHVFQMAFAAIFEDELGGRYYYTSDAEYAGARLERMRTVLGFEYTDPTLFEGRTH